MDGDGEKMKNRVVHFEIGAEDPKKLSEFYRAALGWEINEWPGSNYWLVGKEEDREVGAINGGIMKRVGNYQTINSISVDDLDKAIADVEKNGGKMVKGKQSMPFGEDTMWWCYMADPEGNPFGLTQMVKNVK
jgi:predicted enzyme related to lactoylglutathione lyase